MSLLVRGFTHGDTRDSFDARCVHLYHDGQDAYVASLTVALCSASDHSHIVHVVMNWHAVSNSSTELHRYFVNVYYSCL